jgi:hypothetical protein
MKDFYELAFKTKNAPEALGEVQRRWLVKLRKQSADSDTAKPGTSGAHKQPNGTNGYLVEAVRLSGAFIMSTQGKP